VLQQEVEARLAQAARLGDPIEAAVGGEAVSSSVVTSPPSVGLVAKPLFGGDGLLTVDARHCVATQTLA
jgi:hypothetical protein